MNKDMQDEQDKKISEVILEILSILVLN